VTQTNADIVRALILAQNSGDDETLREHLHPSIEFQTAAGTDGAPTVIRGRDALLDVVAQGRKQEGSFQITLHEVEAEGDHVFVAGTVAGERGMRIPRSWIYRLDDGKIVAMESFAGRAAAQRAWDSLARSND
jgi:ketosteroid isomerase-like protein